MKLSGLPAVRAQRGMAQLPDLHVSDSSEAMLSGRKPPFRLLVRAVASDGRKVNIRHAVSEGFVVRLLSGCHNLGGSGCLHLLGAHGGALLRFQHPAFSSQPWSPRCRDSCWKRWRGSAGCMRVMAWACTPPLRPCRMGREGIIR